MKDRPKVELDRLREIGWREWDPIGLEGSGCPLDEYDTYLLQVVGRLRRGESIQHAADYLEAIASEHMGLGPSTQASRDASARTSVLIDEYLKTLPPGPLQIR